MGLFSGDGSLLLTLIAFLFVLSLVVFIHELGHYLVGRWCGIGAKVFSVGFGPELIGYTDSNGTRWRLSAIPLGGYVRFVGDMNAASANNPEEADSVLEPGERALAFHNKSVGKRAATVFAGPFANYVLAIAIFMIVFMISGRTIIEPVVGEVRTDSAAAAAGIEPGDLFVELDGSPVTSFIEMQRYISPRAETPIDVVIERGSERIALTLTPERLEIEDRFGNKMEQGIIGVVNDSENATRTVQSFGPLGAFVEAHKETWFIIERTAGYIGGVIVGREKADQIGGPIRVAQVSGQVATLGFFALLNLAAILSVSIGLLNLLPIPVLDGGHLLFYGIEAARGRPVSPKSQEYGYRIGFALLIGLMVFATWNDIMMLLDRI